MTLESPNDKTDQYSSNNQHMDNMKCNIGLQSPNDKIHQYNCNNKHMSNKQ